MKIILRNAFVVIISFVFMFAAGCAKKEQIKYSGFIENYPTFQPGPESGIKHVYFKEGVDFGSYNKVMLDHVVFYFSEDSKYKGIKADVLKDLSDEFHKAFIKALKPYFRIVDKPGHDVMRIRTAVTDIVPNKPALSAATTVVPTALAFSFVKKATTGSHTGVRQASMEAEVLDSLTNERIGAVIDTRAGKKSEGLSEWGQSKLHLSSGQRD
jgi:hypothetical protein